MQAETSQTHKADVPPEIDELSRRLSALATRIDTVNGGRRLVRSAEDAPTGKLAPLLKSLIQSRQGAAPVAPALAPPPAPQVAQPDPAPSVPAPQAEAAPDGRLYPRISIPDSVPVPDFQGIIAQQTVQVREREHRLAEVENEKVALAAELATALRDANAATLKLSTVESALARRNADLDSANDIIADLRSELAAAIGGAATQVAAAEDRLMRRHDAERRTTQDAQERRFTELQALVRERDRRVAELEGERAEFHVKIDALTDALRDCRKQIVEAAETIAGKDNQIAFLETVLAVTRDNAEATLKEVVSQFDHERDELAARANAAQTMQRDLLQLLPRLLERRTRPAADSAIDQTAA